MSVPDADLLADAVRNVAGVTGLTGGANGEIATYLPGRRLSGLRLRDGRVDVHILVGFERPVPLVVDGVRRALTPLVAGRPIDVTVADVVEAPS